MIAPRDIASGAPAAPDDSAVVGGSDEGAASSSPLSASSSSFIGLPVRRLRCEGCERFEPLALDEPDGSAFLTPFLPFTLFGPSCFMPKTRAQSTTPPFSAAGVCFLRCEVSGGASVAGAPSIWSSLVPRSDRLEPLLEASPSLGRSLGAGLRSSGCFNRWTILLMFRPGPAVARAPARAMGGMKAEATGRLYDFRSSLPKTHGAIMGAQFGASSGIRSSAEPDSEIHVRETAPREPDPAPSPAPKAPVGENVCED